MAGAGRRRPAWRRAVHFSGWVAVAVVVAASVRRNAPTLHPHAHHAPLREGVRAEDGLPGGPDGERAAGASPAAEAPPGPGPGGAAPSPKRAAKAPAGNYYGMYRGGFTGDFVMSRAKYRKLKRGGPMKIPKYKTQCLQGGARDDCDPVALRADPPRGRGWESIGWMDRSLPRAMPERDEIRSAAKWASCAVVGNGGNLLLAEHGHAIDAHDAVIRFNGGVTKGFELHVGSKTTVRIANTQHMGFHELDSEIVLQHVTQKKMLPKAMGMRAELASSTPSLKLYFLDGDFHQHVLDTVDVGAASNGFYGVVFAHEKCQKVTLFGFFKHWDGNGRYHYYDSVEPNVSQKARDETETARLHEFLDQFPDQFALTE